MDENLFHCNFAKMMFVCKQSKRNTFSWDSKAKLEFGFGGNVFVMHLTKAAMARK